MSHEVIFIHSVAHSGNVSTLVPEQIIRMNLPNRIQSDNRFAPYILKNITAFAHIGFH